MLATPEERIKHSRSNTGTDGTAGRKLSASTQWITLSCKYIGRAVSEGFYKGRGDGMIGRTLLRSW
jgi:hypothetical protein